MDGTCSWIQDTSLVECQTLLFVLRLVVEQNVQKQDDAGGSRTKKEDDGQTGITPDPKARFDAHEQSRANDERGDDQANGDSIGDLLKPMISVFSSIASTETLNSLFAS